VVIVSITLKIILRKYHWYFLSKHREMTPHFTIIWECPKPDTAPLVVKNGNRLIFAEEFIIIYSNKVNGEVSIVAEKKEKQYVSNNAHYMTEWHWERNKELGFSPEKLTCGSGRKVWWRCANGHEWQAIIANRNKGQGCPYCAGRYAVKGINDLQTVNPELAEEWNYEKNDGLMPINVLPNSNKKVWWVCSKGHEWQATINSRNNGNGCPVCSTEQKTSFPEYALVYYLGKYGLEAVHLFKENGYELDVYIPSKRVAIEYDGFYWHKDKVGNDLEKNQKCKKDSIRLYRIREGLPSLSDTSKDYLVHRYQDNLALVLTEVLSDIVGICVDVNLERDALAIENLREHTQKTSSLLLSNPEIAHEWNHEKNGRLKPEVITAGSRKKVWWVCSKGHEWQATIASRNSGNGCPYCSGRRATKGENDLQTINPALAKEWNYKRNGESKPEDHSINTPKKVWWVCNKGHEWQARISHRNNGSGCPYCSGRNAVAGENDLQTVNPSLAKEWNYEKNDGLTPADVLPNSNKKVWWKCSNGHEWQAAIYNRSNGRGCPECSRIKKY
jgi:hypothetical protein